MNDTTETTQDENASEAIQGEGTTNVIVVSEGGPPTRMLTMMEELDAIVSGVPTPEIESQELISPIGKRRGRKKVLSNEDRIATQMFFTHTERAFLSKIGGGNMSQGARIVIQFWENNHQ